MRAHFVCLLISIAVVVISCDDDPVQPKRPVHSSRYLWLDTVSYIHAAVPGQMAEPYVDGDFIVGEPNDPWTPGVPFDDVNGDGDYDAPNLQYEPGEPYYDANRDGDWSAHSVNSPRRWMVRVEAPDTTLNPPRFGFFKRDSVYRFVSDSGFVVAEPEWAEVWDGGEGYYQAVGTFRFLRTDTGLVFTHPAFFEFNIIDTGYITTGVSIDTGRMAFFGYPEVTFRRTTSFITPASDKTLPALGDPLEVIVADFTFEDSAMTAEYEGVSYGFLFTESLGLTQLIINSDAGSELYDFSERFDSMPLLMAP